MWGTSLASHWGLTGDTGLGGIRTIFEYSRTPVVATTTLAEGDFRFYTGGTTTTANSGTAKYDWATISAGSIQLEMHTIGKGGLPSTELADLADGSLLAFEVDNDQWFTSEITGINKVGSIYRMSLGPVLRKNDGLATNITAGATNGTPRFYFDVEPRGNGGPYLGVETYEGDYSNNAMNEGLPGYFDFFPSTGTAPTGLLKDISRLLIDS